MDIRTILWRKGLGQYWIVKGSMTRLNILRTPSLGLIQLGGGLSAKRCLIWTTSLAITELVARENQNKISFSLFHEFNLS